MWHRQHSVLWLAVLPVLLVNIGPGETLSCRCVPESLCPAPDVDLRLDGDGEEECPLGSICCDVPPEEEEEAGVSTGSTTNDGIGEIDVPCDGECVPLREGGGAGNCESDEYDDYGTNLIDVRTLGDSSCPAGYTCRPFPAETCAGTCVPRSMCTMFQSQGKTGGCGTGGNVCCSMDRVSWMSTIEDINAMETDAGPAGNRCGEWHKDSHGSIAPPWLVSIWSRTEVIPGLVSDQFACAGVLTGAQHVLTLASCIEGLSAGDLFANVGDYDLSNRSSLRNTNIYAIRERIIHEDYNSSNPLLRNAVLLRLESKVRDANCVAPLPTTPNERHHSDGKQCEVVGWNKELLAARATGLPRRYETRVKSFNEDLFCAPGTICLERELGCDGSSLTGSPVICGTGGSTEPSLRGILVSNCTGISTEDLATWVAHQQSPGFAQVPKPTVPSRQYLPSL